MRGKYVVRVFAGEDGGCGVVDDRSKGGRFDGLMDVDSAGDVDGGFVRRMFV